MARTTESVINSAVLFGQKVSELFDKVEVRLYGSYFRGDAQDGSDIDLAVISPDFLDMDYILSLKILNRIKNMIDVEIEPISITPDEINNPSIGSIASYISKESKIVFKED